MLGNLMPVFAAMDGIQATNGKQRQNGLDEFPDENPTDKELTDWLDANEPVVVSNVWGCSEGRGSNTPQAIHWGG